MVEITIHLWFAICQYVILALVFIHILFGDLLSKIAYRYLKDKEKGKGNQE